MVGTARSARWPSNVRRRDGRLVPFDVARIETAIGRAAREAGHRDPRLPGLLARSVADALVGRFRSGIPTVEGI